MGTHPNGYDVNMTSDVELIERTTRSVGDRGRMRIVAEHWRESLNATDTVIHDVVELPDGTREIRIREA